ncbi:MAG: endonuclease/exonuclease/phosphatase family protein [Actinomycetota bacterium]
MKKYVIAVLAMVLMTLSAPPAGASHYQRVEVMSQNLYIGADLSLLLTGQATPADLLATVAQTDYRARAVEIAQGIDDFNPDLIGLQEVSLITVFTFDAEGNQVILQQDDYLQILMDELAIVDDRYEVAASVTNANVTLPIDPVNNVFGQVVDRDVVLYRNTTTTIDPESIETGNFAATFTPSFAGVPVPFLRGYVGLDAEVHGRDFRFVNTHLEVSAADGGICLTADGEPFACQEAQATELVEVMAGDDRQTILVGDINAEPGGPAYQTLVDGGYTDTWTIRYPNPRESGVTCCQSETLDNVENQLSKRIDHIFIENSIDPRWTVTTVVGDWEERKTKTTPVPLWYSDHGGPWARLYLS